MNKARERKNWEKKKVDSQENEKVEKFLNISTYSMYYNHERTRNFLFFLERGQGILQAMPFKETGARGL